MPGVDHTELTFGLDTFGDLTVDAAGSALTAPQVLRQVVAEGIRAGEVGIDHFSVGEHHRPDFAVSAPEVVLAGIAARTGRITLGSAVTVLSSATRYGSTSVATLDAISDGRAELTVVRAAEYQLPLMLAIIGGPPSRFRPFVDLYRSRTEGTGLPVGVHSPGFLAATDAEARELLYPHVKANRDRIGRERGWPAVSRADFEAEADGGARLVGSPETVAVRIAAAVSDLGIQRFVLKSANGSMPHEHLLTAIELYGIEVIPRVRTILGTVPNSVQRGPS